MMSWICKLICNFSYRHKSQKILWETLMRWTQRSKTFSMNTKGLFLRKSENHSVSGVTTISLTQCNTSLSHRVDQVVDSGMLVHSSSMAVRSCWTLAGTEHAVVYSDTEHPKDAQRVTCPVSSEEGPPASLLPQATEEIRSELKNPQTVQQLHCGEHPDWLHHCLVRELHHSQLESPVSNSSDGPAHRRRWTSLPPGHLHPAMCEESTEDHQRLLPPEPWTPLVATIRQMVLQHQDQNQQNARQLLLAGHQTAELQIANYTQPTHPSHWISSTHQSHWLWQHCSMSCNA